MRRNFLQIHFQCSISSFSLMFFNYAHWSASVSKHWYFSPFHGTLLNCTRILRELHKEGWKKCGNKSLANFLLNTTWFGWMKVNVLRSLCSDILFAGNANCLNNWFLLMHYQCWFLFNFPSQEMQNFLFSLVPAIVLERNAINTSRHEMPFRKFLKFINASRNRNGFICVRAISTWHS